MLAASCFILFLFSRLCAYTDLHKVNKRIQKFSCSFQFCGDAPDFCITVAANMGKNKCLFNLNWTKCGPDGTPLYPELHPWVRKVDGQNTMARCDWCDNGKKFISISHSGISDLRSHSKSSKHQSFIKDKTNSRTAVFDQFRIPVPALPACESVPAVVENNDDNNGRKESQIRNNPSLDNFVTKDDVTRAEIYLALSQVATKGSLRAFSDLCELFPRMFSDSAIAKKMQMHKDKLAYVITYGLGPFFQDSVVSEVSKCDFFAVSFDESLNKVAKKTQMDLVVRFFTQKVETRYLTSTFLQGAKACDLLESFKNSITGLGLRLSKMINVSMDGPNVNKKFLEDLKAYLRADPEILFKMIDFGSCALHVVHNSFKGAHEKSGWKIQKFMRKQYYFFKDFPSRRGHFTKITGSSEFPLPFCGTRWVENSVGFQQSLKIMTDMKKYFNAINKDPPKSKSYVFLKEFLMDKFLPTKMSFLVTISQELEKFLTKYQSNKPLLPFLHHDLYTMVRNLFKRIVKSKILEKVKNSKDLLNINLDKEENLRSPQQVDIGFGASREIKKFKEDAASLTIRKECRTFIINVCKKLLEKTPLNSEFVKGASCLSPFVMVQRDLAETRVTKALTVLVDHNIFTPMQGEKIKFDYVDLLRKESVVKKLEIFDPEEDQIDVFLAEICKKEKMSKIFLDFIKVITIVFHGNAAVERSFSFNKQFLVENLQEPSLIAQRSVHDLIVNTPGGVKNIEITQPMMTAFRNSSAKRRDALVKQKLEQDSETKKKKQAFAQIKELRMKKQKALESEKMSRCEIEECERALAKLEKSLNK